MLKGDLVAGLTVGVMLIPQAMAYALIAGLPPVYGLYAALVPLLIYGMMGTSRHLGVGPVAVVALLVAAGVSGYAVPGSTEYISLAILLALMVGIIQLLMGLLRMGFLVNFLSHPVITGFTAAAALIIAFSQIHNLLGITVDSSAPFYQVLIQVFTSLSDIHPVTAGLGIGAVIFIYGIKKWNKHFPGALVAVAGSIGLVAAAGLNQNGISIVGEVASGLPAFGLADWDLDIVYSLLPMAVAISLVGFMESIAVAKTIQTRHRDYQIDANQELVALGSANIGGSFFQAFPVAGSFSRSAINDQSGAKSGMASIISALLIGLTLLFLTPLIFYLPYAVLAAIIITAVLGLIDINEMKFLWNTRKEDFFMMVITFFVTLILGIEEGILAGVIASLGVVIYYSSKPHVAHLGRLPGSRIYRNVLRFSEAEEREDVLVYRYDAPLFFANVQHFKETAEKLNSQKGDRLRLVVLDASGMNSIDATGIHVLFELDRQLSADGIALWLAAVNGPVRDILHKSGFAGGDSDRFCSFEVQEAIDAFDKKESERKQQTPGIVTGQSV